MSKGSFSNYSMGWATVSKSLNQSQHAPPCRHLLELPCLFTEFSNTSAHSSSVCVFALLALTFTVDTVLLPHAPRPTE